MATDRALLEAAPDQVAPADVPRLVELLTRKHLTRLDVRRREDRPPRGYRPHRKQAVVHATRTRWKKRFRVLNWGRRCGKTRCAAADTADQTPQLVYDRLTGRGLWDGRPQPLWSAGRGKDPEPAVRIGIVAPTYALLREPKVALQSYLGRVEDGGWIVHQTAHEWWLLGGVRVDWLSADRPERLVSQFYHLLWLDEAARMKASVWRDNLAPTLADSGGGALFTSTPLGKNWFYTDIWARSDLKAAQEVAEEQGEDVSRILDPSYANIFATTLDNTTVPRLQEEVMAMRGRMPEAMWRRNFMASFASIMGACFPLPGQQHRLREVPPAAAMRHIWGGLDWGQTHRACFGVGGETYLGRYIVADAIARGDTDGDGDDAWARRDKGDETVWSTIAYNMLVRWVGRDRWRTVPVYLPHDAVEVKRRWRHRGFNVHEAWQDPASSLDWAKVALHNNELQIGPRVVWASMVQLHHPEKGRWSNKPWEETDDDPWDMVRYLFSDPMQRGRLKADPRGLLGLGMR